MRNLADCNRFGWPNAENGQWPNVISSTTYYSGVPTIHRCLLFRGVHNLGMLTIQGCLLLWGAYYLGMPTAMYKSLWLILSNIISYSKSCTKEHRG